MHSTRALFGLAARVEPVSKALGARLRASKAPLTVTPAAQTKLREIVAERVAQGDPAVVRLGVKRYGCNGYAYTMDYSTPDMEHKFDEVIDIDDIKLRIDHHALFTVINSEMDFESSKLRSGFVFRNPNAEAACACGVSFTTTGPKANGDKA